MQSKKDVSYKHRLFSNIDFASIYLMLNILYCFCNHLFVINSAICRYSEPFNERPRVRRETKLAVYFLRAERGRGDEGVIHVHVVPKIEFAYQNEEYCVMFREGCLYCVAGLVDLPLCTMYVV